MCTTPYLVQRALKRLQGCVVGESLTGVLDRRCTGPSYELFLRGRVVSPQRKSKLTFETTANDQRRPFAATHTHEMKLMSDEIFASRIRHSDATRESGARCRDDKSNSECPRARLGTCNDADARATASCVTNAVVGSYGSTNAAATNSVLTVLNCTRFRSSMNLTFLHISLTTAHVKRSVSSITSSRHL